MTATLKPAIPSGGILSQNVEVDFTDYVSGRPLTQRVVIAVVQAGSIGADTLEKGRVNKVKYETVHLVEITDQHEADQLRHRITQLRADRGFAAKQPALWDATETEQRESLLDMIKDWASEKDLALTDLDQRFVTYFGGSEHASAESVQACRSLTQLKEFALDLGVLADTKPGENDEPDTELGAEPTEDGTEEPPTDPHEGEPVTDESTDESPGAALRSVPFQDAQ